jgi:hypothetical protein
MFPGFENASRNPTLAVPEPARFARLKPPNERNEVFGSFCRGTDGPRACPQIAAFMTSLRQPNASFMAFPVHSLCVRPDTAPGTSE